MHGATVKVISFCYAVPNGDVTPIFGLFVKVTQIWYPPPKKKGSVNVSGTAKG